MSFVDLSAPGDEEPFEDEPPLTAEEEPAPPVELEPEEPGLPPLPEDDDDAAWERQARTMGWHPQGEYRGDPRRWTPAKEYVETAYREFPVMRERLRRMVEKDAKRDEQMTALNQRLDQQTSATRQAMAAAKRAEQVGYDRAKADLLERRRAAVTAADEQAFDEVEAELVALEEGKAAAPPLDPEPAPSPSPPAPPAEPVVQPAPEVQAFMDRNRWFTDPAMKHVQQAMIAQHVEVQRAHPEWSLADQLDEALERLSASFPGRFTPAYSSPDAEPAPMAAPVTPQPVQRPRRAAPTTPGAPRRVAGGSPLDQIADPDERTQAKGAFAAMKRADPEFTEAEYMQIYNNPHLDVLELRTQRKR